MRTATPGRIEIAFKGQPGSSPLDAHFSVPTKGVTAIFGPTGCGKAAVARCIAGLEHLPSGFCAIDGEVWQDETTFRPPHMRPIGYVFQQASLFPHLSVKRNLLYGARKAEPTPNAFEEVIELMGIAPLLDRSPAHLSGGERQRIAIGRALLSQPRLLVMDEPLAALDRCAKSEILPFLERLHEKVALPMIYITHVMVEIERLANHLVIMEHGTVTAAGPLHVLQTDPALPLAASREAAVSLDAVVGVMTDAMGYSSFASKVRACWCRRRRFHRACANGCASQPATSASHASRRAQTPSSMFFRADKGLFRLARVRLRWCLHSGARARRFWRALRVSPLTR